MKIIGYSERGAMNALFYGMAFDKENGGKHICKFLEMAKIPDANSFSDFELYNEFSLSEYGEPDLVIIAKKNNVPVVLFVEAKVSDGTSYNMETQKKNHEKDLQYYLQNYIEKREKRHKKNDASNLFFQLRLKNFFFETHKPKDHKDDTYEEHECIMETKDRNGEIRRRKLGDNPIVNKFANKIKKCHEAYFVAIVPKQEQEGPIDYPIYNDKTMRIYFVSWEDILKEGLGQLDDTFVFNKVGEISQILNRSSKK